jgi:hypothetical protein
MRTLSNISNYFTLTDYSEMYLENDGSFMRERSIYSRTIQSLSRNAKARE